MAVMKGVTVALTFLCTSVAGLSLEAEAQERPIVKVVRLLKEMKSEVEGEGKADTEAYEKMACWCETNEKDKTKAIHIAKQTITKLTSSIEEYTARSGQLTSEIEESKKDRTASEKALAEATEIREKEASLFADEEKELLGLISALTRAVKLIGANHGESFLQLKQAIHHINLQYADALRSDWNDIVDPPLSSFLKTRKSAHHVLTGFEQALEAGPAGFKSYNAASGQILGMLKQMLDTFKANLENARKEESAKATSFADLKAAKEAEIKSLSEQINDKTTELSDTDVKNAQAKQDLEAMTEALAADEKFLENLKVTCSRSDAEYEERSKARQTELDAIQEVILMLTSDESRSLMNKTVQFLQKQQSFGDESVDELAQEGKLWRPRDQAAAVLSAVARRHGSPMIAAIALSAHLDAFTKVKKAIDDMIVELKKQQKEEYEKRDWCNEELDKNEDSTKENTWKKEDLDSQIADLTETIAELTTDIDNLNKDISNARVQMKRAGEDRAGANKEFQVVVADQRATVGILNKAMQRLQKVYQPEALTAAPVAATRVPMADSMALLQSKQTPGAAAPPPPAASQEYSKSGGGVGIVNMISMIIEDAKRLVNTAIKDEQEAQAGYESFVADSNNAIATDEREIVHKSEAKSKATKTLEEASESHKYTVSELEKLSKMNGDLHADCDYVLKNFDIRQQARAEEMEAMDQAKAILSGAQ